jgi:hypothetical protein
MTVAEAKAVVKAKYPHAQCSNVSRWFTSGYPWYRIFSGPEPAVQLGFFCNTRTGAWKSAAEAIQKEGGK